MTSSLKSLNKLKIQQLFWIKKSLYSTSSPILPILNNPNENKNVNSNDSINNNKNNNNEKEIKKKNRLIVKDLYKQLMYLGRVGFLGVDYIRDKAKPQFLANANLTNNNKINECIERTKYVIKEIEAMNRFHKYRNLKKSYDLEFQKINDNFLDLNNDKK
ncbi:hypothetical protein ACTFIV_003845 [Dictyostelium citrinum]